MIIYCGPGDILNSDMKTVVIPVNTVGAMGSGLALWFKLRYPDIYLKYKAACKADRFKIGQLWFFKGTERNFLLLPTKRHWMDPSKVEYVEASLLKLAECYGEKDMISLAMPPIGCGLGGLDFESDVKPLLYKHLGPLPLPVSIYLKGNNHARK